MDFAVTGGEGAWRRWRHSQGARGSGGYKRDRVTDDACGIGGGVGNVPTLPPRLPRGVEKPLNDSFHVLRDGSEIVTTFKHENSATGRVEGADLTSYRSEAGGRHMKTAEWIPRRGIESSAHDDELSTELCEERQHCRREESRVLCVTCAWRFIGGGRGAVGDVDRAARALADTGGACVAALPPLGPRIKTVRCAVDRYEEHGGVVGKECGGAITSVDIKIDDGDTIDRVCSLCVSYCNGNGV